MPLPWLSIDYYEFLNHELSIILKKINHQSVTNKRGKLIPPKLCLVTDGLVDKYFPFILFLFQKCLILLLFEDQSIQSLLPSFHSFGYHCNCFIQFVKELLGLPFSKCILHGFYGMESTPPNSYCVVEMQAGALLPPFPFQLRIKQYRRITCLLNSAWFPRPIPFVSLPAHADFLGYEQSVHPPSVQTGE